MANEEIGHKIEWTQQLRAVSEALEPLHGVLGELDRWLWQHVVASDDLPRKLPDEIADLLQRLGEGLQAGESAASEAFQRFSARPLAKFLAGMRLSEEEFYILGGMGVLPLGLTDVTAFEAFSMLYYEDDRRHGYINPAEIPRQPGYPKLRFGIIPEEVCMKFLRPEQDTFLRTRFPELYARFSHK